MKAHHYLIVDPDLDGTGIRTDFSNEEVELSELNIGDKLTTRIQTWLSRYHDHQRTGFEDVVAISDLDAEGVSITEELRRVLAPTKIAYYSEAEGRRLLN